MPYRNTPYHVNFQGGFSGFNNPGGQVFYVAASGYTAVDGIGASDSNDGKSPQTPFSTIQAALNACTAGRGDIVAVLPGSYTITAALTMTNADVTLCAAHPVEPYAYPGVLIVSATDASMLEIDAANCRVEGIGFDINIASATANLPIVDVADSTASSGVIIKNCFFDCAGADSDLDVIRLGDGTVAATDCVVEGCTLYDVDQIGIYIRAASDENRILNNLIFDGVSANAATNLIQCDGDGCIIMGNVLSTSGTAGIATGPGGAVANTIMANNYIWARGANTIGILSNSSGNTNVGLGNWIGAAAAGNIFDFTTSSTTPSCSVDTGNVYGADPAAAALTTATVDGS